MSRLVTSIVAIAGATALVGSVAGIFSLDEKRSSSASGRTTRSHDLRSSPSMSAPAATSAQESAASAQLAAAAPAQVAEPARTTASERMASATQSAPAKATEPLATAGSAGQRVSIDPKTGQHRPIEHDEAAALAAAAAAQGPAARRAAAQPRERFGPGGVVTVDIPEDLHTYTVATRRPDGTIAIEHATGPKAARKNVTAAAPAKKMPAAPATPVQDKEDRDDR